MKTTIDISDALFQAAKKRANEQGTTFRALVEEGLRSVLQEPSVNQGFTLRDESVTGNGLHPDVGDGGWERIAELIYEGRGT